jgi:hypothetical protein
MTVQSKRGGPGRNQGRKPLAPGEASGDPVSIRMTQAQRAKLAALGGGKWVREKIDAAIIPEQCGNSGAPQK